MHLEITKRHVKFKMVIKILNLYISPYFSMNEDLSRLSVQNTRLSPNVSAFIHYLACMLLNWLHILESHSEDVTIGNVDKM
jgi:hypothetical protein